MSGTQIIIALGAIVVILGALAAVASRRRRPKAASAAVTPAAPGAADRPLDPAIGNIVARTSGSGAGRDVRELYDDAVRIVAEVGTPSALVLQRKLDLTFEQATALLRRMEEDGFVGTQPGAQRRKVLPAAYEFAVRGREGRE